MNCQLRMLLFGFSAIAGTAPAHHSISGVYDSGESVTVRGTVAEFRFVNPHPLLIIEVAGGTAAETWLLEMDNRFELVAAGLTAETFRPGDRVVVTGSPARERSQRLYLRRLDRPADGLVYEQRGTRPRLRH
jgi:DNA helicase HerA-like ATPase